MCLSQLGTAQQLCRWGCNEGDGERSLGVAAAACGARKRHRDVDAGADGRIAADAAGAENFATGAKQVSVFSAKPPHEKIFLE